MDETPTQPDNASTGPLSFLKPRETRRAIRARGTRPMVARLKIALPIISGLALMGLIIWPYVHKDKILKSVLKNVPDIVIENLNYTGADSKNQPYSISALKATRPSGVQNIYDLEKPQGEITLQEGNWIAAKSMYGRLDQDTHHLWLGGDVQIFHDKGIQFTTDELQADLEDRYAWGEKPVLIQGDFGEIRGAGFKLLESGSIMVVTGPAKALLNLHAGDASDKPKSTP